MSGYLQNAELTVKNFGPAMAEGVEPGLFAAEENGFQGERPPAPAPVRLPNPSQNRQSVPAVQTVSSGFTLVAGDCKVFAKEYTPKMECPNYIGDTEMLLKYLFREERRNRITMPIRTCGIDPIVFDNVEHLESNGEDEEQAPSSFFAIQDDVHHEDDEEGSHIYELIEVDGNLYLSCMSECLDEEYLHRVITEATTTMRETGTYIFRMVGLRRLAVTAGEGGVGAGRLLETLRLNTFEMSALCSYMADFGVEPTFEIIDGHRCICFRAR